MKILVAFPDSYYYNWQILIQINNLIKFGYANDMIFLVGKNPKKQISSQLKNVLDNTSVEYYVYDDTRKIKEYAVSLTPHIISKFFIENPQYLTETFFYIDPDVVFTKPISFGTLLNNDTWYVSDTRSYIDSKYIRSKGEDLFDSMCKKVGVDRNFIISKDANAGGAQYLMKNLTVEYWEKVYVDCEKLYEFLKRTESGYNPEHPIQTWTSEMWSILWNGWKSGHDVKIASRLSFAWATNPIVELDNHSLLHMAGVVDQTNLFKKSDYYVKSPFNADLSHVSPDFCSYKYLEEIEETKNNYPELINLF